LKNTAPTKNLRYCDGTVAAMFDLDVLRSMKQDML
jgi:hypothetical protein